MKKQLVLFLALALCLGLTACGDTESDDTQSGYETVMDMEFLDGMWSIDGTAKLYFDSTGPSRSSSATMAGPSPSWTRIWRS